MESTWILRRFEPLPLGSSSTSAAPSAAEPAGAAQGVQVWAISSCVSGRAMVSPGCHQPRRCKQTPCGSSWWCAPEEDVPELLPAGASGGPPPPVWWPTQTNRAMAARSARMSSSEEESRSTEEEERLLTERCIEMQWKNNVGNTFLSVERQKTNTFTGSDSDVSRRSTPLTFQCDFCVSMKGKEPTSDCSKEHNTGLPWGRGHVHPCCCLFFDKQAPAPSPLSLHRCCRQHDQKSQKPQLLLIDCGTRCKRRRRCRTAPAIKLPVCNGKDNNTHTPWNEQQRNNEGVRVRSGC